MMKKLLTILVSTMVFEGCVKNPAPIPSTEIGQHQDVTQTNEVCYRLGLDFDHYIFTGDESSDSIQWFQVSLGDTTALGTGFTAEVPTYPFPSLIFRYEFHGGDTLVGHTGFGICYRALYIPNAFTPYYNNGLNDTWQPILYNTDEIAATMSWRILSPSGTLMFETDAIDGSWDGTHDGTQLYPGPFLYHITLNIPEEGVFEYSGTLSLLEG